MTSTIQSVVWAVMSGLMKNAATQIAHTVPAGPKILCQRFSARKGRDTMQRNGSGAITCIKQGAGSDMNGAENNLHKTGLNIRNGKL